MKKIIILMAMISMFLMSMVYADDITCAIIEPDTGDAIQSTTIMNVSFTGGTGNATMTLYINMSSPSTANSSVGTLVVSLTNLTGAALMANGSINTTFLGVLEDSNDYTVEMAVEGGDGLGRVDCSGTATTVNIDRTSPSAPTTTQASQSVLKAGNVITYTVTGTDTTKCRISFQTSKISKSSGTNTFAMVHSGDTCTYTIPSITIGDGVYSMSAWASDETNSTFSSIIDIEVDNIASNTQLIEDGLQVGIGEAIGEKVKDNQLVTIAIIVIIVLLIWRAGKKK